MTKLRRGGYVFVTWKGDHVPRHVHVFRDGRLVAKWDLESRRPITGRVSSRLAMLILELEDEGAL